MNWHGRAWVNTTDGMLKPNQPRRELPLTYGDSCEGQAGLSRLTNEILHLHGDKCSIFSHLVDGVSALGGDSLYGELELWAAEVRLFPGS